MQERGKILERRKEKQYGDAAFNVFLCALGQMKYDHLE